MDELPPRERYRARRRQIETRRRVSLLIGGGVALVLAAVIYWLLPLQPGPLAVKPATSPEPASGTARTELSVAPTLTPSGSGLPPTAESASVPVATLASPQLSQLLDPLRLTYEPNFYLPQINAVIEAMGSPLRQVQIQVGNRTHSFAEVLVGQTSLYSVNPKLVLAIFELQSRAVSGASPDGLKWAAGFHGDNGRRAGLNSQLLWLIRELHHAQRDYTTATTLTYADGSSLPVPQGLTMPEYALARVLAPTVNPGGLGPLLGDGPGSFFAVYSQLFEDPRPAQLNLPPPATPFLLRPTEYPFPIASFFDHDAPFLAQNGALTTYWNVTDDDVAYDGHDGWDYAMEAPDKVLAAASGTVVFAGNSDDGCSSPAQVAIVDHANGYRTLYWHLSQVLVETGQQVVSGQQLGVVGASGCARGEHLHFQVQYLGRDTDPFGWCGGEAIDPWAAHPAGNRSTWLWANRPSPCGSPPPGSILVDAGSPGFTTVSEGWQQTTPGYGGATLFASSRLGADDSQPWELRDPATPPVAVWQPRIMQPGRYRVLAYIPFTAAVDGLSSYAPFRWSSIASSLKVRYLVGHRGGTSEVLVDQATLSNDWAELGVFEFDASTRPYVALSPLAGKSDFGVWADAVVWLPAN